MVPISAAVKLDELDIKVRRLKKDDLGFIFSTWKKSYRDEFKWVPAFIFFPSMHTQIEKYRKDERNVFAIACDPDDEDFIFGWACLAPDCVHYCYVKPSFQRARVASRLLGKRDKIICSHWTKVCEEIQREKPGLLVYEPSRR